MSEIKFKPILGSLPEMLSEWWTEEDRMRHNEYVARLKEQGKYLTEGEEITIGLTACPIFNDQTPFGEAYRNFGLLIPKGITDESPKIPYKKEL